MTGLSMVHTLRLPSWCRLSQHRLVLLLGMAFSAQAGMTKEDHLAMFDLYATGKAEIVETKDCGKCTYEGHFFPIFGKDEMEWSNWIRVPLYSLGLAWTFLGIATVSDVFMAGIEKVTSWKKRVKDQKTGRTMTIYVWNATVANLTLMALGSSAPEIMLSLIEITTSDPPMFMGSLGAGTIVGSAAFNLLVISAVCVLAIPEPEVRYIKQTTVYIVTAVFSVFAYLWLIFILGATSPNVCEVWEAVLTLLFCPILVLLAFAADKGYADAVGGVRQSVLCIPDNVTPDELAMIEQQIREAHGPDLTAEQVAHIMSAKYFTMRSRAYYRRLAMQRNASKNRRSIVCMAADVSEFAVSKVLGTHDIIDKETQDKEVLIGFETARYAFLEDCGHAQLVLVRTGPPNCKASVNYKTRDGTAVEVEDYEAAEGTITFEVGEMKKPLKIKILDDNAYEDNEEFYVDLSEPSVEDTNGASYTVNLSEVAMVTVVIIDDDDPGVIKFKQEEVEVIERKENSTADIHIERSGGASGTISFLYNTEDMSAVAGMDYEDVSGKIEMGPAVQSHTIQVPILAKGRYEKTSDFLVRLTDANGCVFDKETDGKEECCICHVTIKGNQDEQHYNVIRRMQSRINSQQAILGHRHWREQFYNALFTVNEDDGEEEDEDPSPPTVMEIAMHIVGVPWKLLFAFIPPVDYCGGWLCFFMSLIMIGVVTAIVEQLANLVGCCLGIHPEITAITFVALGTSLPDTFASKAAAMMDPYADASIANVTGSNSVNVFIGLGLSWSIAAIYWASQKPTEAWMDKVAIPGGIYYDIREDVAAAMIDGNAVFVSPAGSLSFNVCVFVFNAFLAINHLFGRRKKFGGELGGPRRGWGGQYFSACFLLLQWVIYVTASSIYAQLNDPQC